MYFYIDPQGGFTNRLGSEELESLINDASGKVTFDSAYLKGGNLIAIIQTADDSPPRLLCQDDMVFSSETRTPTNSGFIPPGNRLALILENLSIISITDATFSSSEYARFATVQDYRTVLCSVSSNSVLILRSYDEAAIAYDLGKPFVFDAQDGHRITIRRLARKISGRLGREIDIEQDG